MFIGHGDIKKSFIMLVEKRVLSHGYIFYGEPQVGKRLFAKCLANYIENGGFEEPTRVLSETLFVEPNKEESSESVGIDAVRDIKNFLFQQPQASKFRIAVINDAHLMTDQAQNAILKIAEEPPEHALLILITTNLELLLPTLLSRFQKIYFGALGKNEVRELLIGSYKVKSAEAEKIMQISFGRPGRAIDLVSNEKFKSIRADALAYLSGKANKKDLIAELADIENKDRIEPFLNEVIAELSVDVGGNRDALKSVLYRLRTLKEWNTNRRLQLEAALRSISND